jgi:hypothetical protein
MVKKEQESHLFFVQIRDPVKVRRGILETLKEIVEVLQRFEKFRQLRHEKLEKINHLRVLLRQANRMLGDLRGKLPQTNLRAAIAGEAPVHKVPRKKKKSKASEEKAPQKREMTHLEKLEAELSAIESKLKSLT